MATKNRLAKLRNMRTDATIKIAADSTEVYNRIQEDEPIKYAIGAMKELDPDYTANTIAEGDRIKSQLDKDLNAGREVAEFEYQGSVTNNTHVKVHSDLDLLTIHTDSHVIEPPGKPASIYQGDPLADLKWLRSASAKSIKNAFPKVTVDESGAKCIALSGGSLRREIDLVFANWWHTADYQAYRLKIYKGVKVLDLKSSMRKENKPFLHNYRIDAKDKETAGNLRKVVRLLKSLKYNADVEVKISSYDIASIGYTMPETMLVADKRTELRLVEQARSYLAQLVANQALRESLSVPNGTRKIFGGEGATYDGLLALYSEVHDLAEEIKASLTKTFRKMTDTQITY